MQGSFIGGGDERLTDPLGGSLEGLEGEGEAEGEDMDMDGLGSIREEGMGGEVMEDAAYDPGEVSRRRVLISHRFGPWEISHPRCDPLGVAIDDRR